MIHSKPLVYSLCTWGKNEWVSGILAKAGPLLSKVRVCNKVLRDKYCVRQFIFRITFHTDLEKSFSGERVSKRDLEDVGVGLLPKFERGSVHMFIACQSANLRGGGQTQRGVCKRASRTPMNHSLNILHQITIVHAVTSVLTEQLSPRVAHRTSWQNASVAQLHN